MQQAQRLALRAIQLAPQNGEAWLARGLAEMHAGQPVAAAAAFRRAMSVAPSLPAPRVQLAALLADVGWFMQARQQLEVALELGGDATAILGELARIAVLEGDTVAREGVRRQKRARGLAPYSIWRGLYSGALATNNRALLLETYREMAAHEATPLPPFIAALYVVLGSVLRETPPDAHLALLPTVGFGDGATPTRRCRTLLLWMELRKGEADVEWILDTLRQAIGYGLSDATWFDRSDCLAPVRDLPEFGQMRQLIAQRTASIVDAYCSDAISQPSPRADVGMETEGF